MRFSVAAAFLLAAAPVFAQPPASPGPQATRAAEPERPVPPPTVSVTRHTGMFGGQRVAYTATASETYLKADDGTPKAAIFSVAYVKEPRDPSRPVIFLYNDGPGWASFWLQMGAFGPKRVSIPSDARDDGAPPYPILDNPDSLLDVTDIVFIDPVGTGFSHTLGKT